MVRPARLCRAAGHRRHIRDKCVGKPTGEVMEAQLGEAATKDMTVPGGRHWIPRANGFIGPESADLRLTEVRRNVLTPVDWSSTTKMPAPAEILSNYPASKITVLSDDPTASSKIEEFSAGTQRWMVAVRMVSEGVDVPRLVGWRN